MDDLYWKGYRAGAEAALGHIADSYDGLDLKEAREDHPSPYDDALQFVDSVIELGTSWENKTR